MKEYMALRKALGSIVEAQLEAALSSHSSENITISKESLRRVFLDSYDTIFSSIANFILADIHDDDLKAKIKESLFEIEN